MLKKTTLNIAIVIMALFAALTTHAQEAPAEDPAAAAEESATQVKNDPPAAPEKPEKPGKLDSLEPPASPFAQAARDTDAKEKDEKKNPRTRKFLALTLGVSQDEKLPGKMPPVFSFKGDFKKNVSVLFAKDINSLRFNPVKEGVSTLTVHDSKGRVVVEYRIEVRKSRLDTIMREMQGLLGDIEGISLKVVNNKVVVDGQILLPRDMNRIYNVVSQYGDQATSIVSMSPLAQKKIAEFIARDINNPDITVRAVNDKFILEGVAKSDEERNRAEVIAKMYVPAILIEKAEADKIVFKKSTLNDGIINLITIQPQAAPPPGKIIQLIIHYVELQKDYEKAFRFQWTPGIDDKSGMHFTAGDGGGGAGTTISGTIYNLLPKLNWAKEHGYGRVLESSSLIVQDGKKGVLNSFQEIPYQTAAAGGTGVPMTQFKKVGMSSAITPIVGGERSDSINLTIEFQVSALSGFAGGAPTTSNNELQTDIVVRSGQSAAIGGLITNRSNTGYNKLPQDGASNPIISLYASRQFQRNQSQFVVFITPIIKSSASAGAEKIKKKFRLHE